MPMPMPMSNSNLDDILQKTLQWLTLSYCFLSLKINYYKIIIVSSWTFPYMFIVSFCFGIKSIDMYDMCIIHENIFSQIFLIRSDINLVTKVTCFFVIAYIILETSPAYLRYRWLKIIRKRAINEFEFLQSFMKLCVP